MKESDIKQPQLRVPFRTHHLHTFFQNWEMDRIPLDLALYHYFRERRSLGSKDRKSITESVFEMIKWRRLIDFPEENLSYQERIDRYLEGNFRRFKDDPTVPPDIRVSLPKFIWEDLEKGYGKDAALRIGEILNTRAPLTLRTNTLKTTRAALFNTLKDEIDVVLTEKSPWGLKILEGAKVRELPSYQAGHFEIQDEGSQLLAERVQIKPGEVFLDYCSGSGGKSLAVAMQMQGRGQLFLHDSRMKSLYEAKERLARAGIQNYQLLPPDSANKKRLRRMVDWVLVDAPCSGMGTLRRGPELKWKLTPETIAYFVELQRKVFEEALAFIKSSGRLVYATCSLLLKENEEQVSYFLARHPVDLESSVTIFPEEGGCDGFFAATFKLKK